MQPPLDDELELIRALRLTGDPPRSWIDAAAEIPSTLGDLAAIERIVDSPEFRARFAEHPKEALAAAGLPATEAVVAAVRERIG